MLSVENACRGFCDASRAHLTAGFRGYFPGFREVNLARSHGGGGSGGGVVKGVEGKVRDHCPRQVHGHCAYHLFCVHKHLSGSLHPVMQPQQFGVTDPGVACQLDGFQVGEEAREVGLQALEMVVS